MSEALPSIGVGRASGFFDRLLGIHGPCARHGAVWFPRCASVHTLWTRRALCIVFLDRDRRVLAWKVSRWGRIYRHPRADSVLEIDLTALPVGTLDDHLVARTAGCVACLVPSQQRLRKAPSGLAMVESLIAAPIVLMLGLLVLQLILLAHGRLMVGYAAAEAARAAASAQITAAAIDSGLRRGLLPLLGISARQPSPGLDDLAAATVRGQMQYLRGKAEGWIRWTLLSPTAATLADWGQGAEQAIPPAQWLSGAFPAPRSGPAAVSGGTSGGTSAVAGLTVGRSSGQSFLDAGVIQLQVTVGLPLHVPLAGPLLARGLAWWRGCSTHQTECLGSLTIGSSRSIFAAPAWGERADLNECRLLRASGWSRAFSQGPARLPVRVIGVAQAQTVFSAQTLAAR